MLAIKLTEKISDSLNTEEQYQSFVRKKNAKSAKQSKNQRIKQSATKFENPNTVDIKSVFINHPITSHNISKTLSEAEKVSQVGLVIQKSENFLNEKKCKNNLTSKCF